MWLQAGWHVARQVPRLRRPVTCRAARSGDSASPFCTAPTSGQLPHGQRTCLPHTLKQAPLAACLQRSSAWCRATSAAWWKGSSSTGRLLRCCLFALVYLRTRLRIPALVCSISNLAVGAQVQAADGYAAHWSRWSCHCLLLEPVVVLDWSTDRRCKQLMEILPTGVGAVYRLLKLLNQARGSVQFLVGIASPQARRAVCSVGWVHIMLTGCTSCSTGWAAHVLRSSWSAAPGGLLHPCPAAECIELAWLPLELIGLDSPAICPTLPAAVGGRLYDGATGHYTQHT